MPYEHELEAALEAGRQAGEALREAYGRFKVIPDAPASISTDADRQSQEIILEYLREQFPGDAFCAEEATATLAAAAHTGPRLWVVDPIDGTRGFARKNGEFSVMVAFVNEGRVGVGVVLQPVQGWVTYGTRGGGGWQRVGSRPPMRCRVSKVGELARATLTQSHTPPGKRSRCADQIGPARVVETYSAGIKLAMVALCEADIY